MYDALVVGLGAMGSATLYELSKRGLNVAGVDAFDPPHTLGSTHGRSRIIREAYYEHPSYVPLVRRAYEKWAELERASNRKLLISTGALMIGAPDSELIVGTRASAAEHSLSVEFLGAAEIRERFPACCPDDSMVGVLEKNAGILFPERCIEAFLSESRRLGATIHTNMRVNDITRTDDVSTIHCGDLLLATKNLVLCAGAWNSDLLQMLNVALPLEVERQTMHWFDAPQQSSQFAPAAFPVIMIEDAGGTLFYAIPDVGDGVKAAIHHGGAKMTIGAMARNVDGDDTDPVARLAKRFLPALGEIRESVVCVYTNTPDRDFAIGELPMHTGVFVVSACSGHGFKFASAIGEIMADRCTQLPVSLDMSRFAVGRLAS